MNPLVSSRTHHPRPRHLRHHLLRRRVSRRVTRRIRKVTAVKRKRNTAPRMETNEGKRGEHEVKHHKVTPVYDCYSNPVQNPRDANISNLNLKYNITPIPPPSPPRLQPHYLVRGVGDLHRLQRLI